MLGHPVVLHRLGGALALLTAGLRNSACSELEFNVTLAVLLYYFRGCCAFIVFELHEVAADNIRAARRAAYPAAEGATGA